MAAAAQTTTHTTLKAETREVNGHTVATFSATVLDENGSPATGVVTLVDSVQGRPIEIAGSALDAQGKAEINVDSLTAGDHALHAVYKGDSSHAVSQSNVVAVHPQATATPDFTLAIAPTSLTVKEGGAGSVVATIAPVASSGFTGFISLSCSGTGQTTTLPVGVTCTYSPANLQVTSTAAVTATLSIQTSTAGGKHAEVRAPGRPFATGTPVALAILLPGVVGLGILGRKRKLYGRLALLAMVGAFSLLGTTACSARYGYLNHGPTFGGTPLGSYTITVTAQTSNGVTATAHSTPLALTVN